MIGVSGVDKLNKSGMVVSISEGCDIGQRCTLESPNVSMGGNDGKSNSTAPRDSLSFGSET